MSTDGVLGAAFLPRDGYLDPSQLTFALADGARHYGAEINTRTRVTAIERDARGRVCRVVTDRGEIETEVVVDAAGMAAPDVARLVGVTVPIIPMAHQYLITEPFDPPLAAAADAARPRQPRLLAHGGRRARDGRLRARSRAVRARRHPRGLRGAAPDLGLRALRGADGGLDPARARRWRRPRSRSSSTAPRRSRPTASSSSASRRCRASGSPRGSARTASPGAGGIGKVMAEWIVDGQPEWDLWHMDIRRFGRQYRSQAYTLARTAEVYSTYYDIKYPGEERLAGRPLRVLAGLRAAHRQRRELRREVRLGARQLVRPERRRRRRVAAPARLGGPALVAGDRGRVPRGGRARGADRPVLVREDRRPRPGRVRVPRPPVRERGRPPARIGHLHAAAQRARRHRGRRHARAARERPLPLRDGHGVRLAQPRLAAPAPARTGCTPTTSPRRARATASGARARATSCSR